MTNASGVFMSGAAGDRSSPGGRRRPIAGWRGWCAALVSALVLAVGAAPARADWLVLSSGEAVETRGPWKVEGRTIVFTSTRGVLSSIRTTSVDLDSSRALTVKKQEEATRVVVPQPAPRREPVLVLTDADFAPAAASGTAPGAAPAQTAAATAGEPIVVPASDSLETRVARQMPGAPSLRIMSWSARPTGEDELSILGYVQNVGSLVSAAVSVTVTLYDSEGTQIGSTQAALSSTALMPGVQAFLEAKFPGDPNFAAVEFALSTVELQIGSDAAPGADEAEAESGAEGVEGRETQSPESTEGQTPEEGREGLPEAPVREAPQPKEAERPAP